MDTLLSLMVIAVIPVFVSVPLYFLLRQDRFKKISEAKKQIAIGIIFGIIAIIGTEFGVPYKNEAIINARDAAPLCAALIFGGPAGIIAGLIGGIERWFSVYWSGGYYTRVACSISTFLTGFNAAVLKKYVFDDKLPDLSQTLIIGIVAEVLHMIMIFVTNMNDVVTAFEYVRICTAPMVLVNALSVALAVFTIQTIDKDYTFDSKVRYATISAQLQRNIVTLVFLGFIISSLFITYLQNSISMNSTHKVLEQNIQDVINDTEEQCDQEFLNDTVLISANIGPNSEYTLEELREMYCVEDIYIINRYGVITDSTDSESINYNMISNEKSKQIMYLRDRNIGHLFIEGSGKTDVVGDKYPLYCALRNGDGILLTAVMEQQIEEMAAKKFAQTVTNRHVGEGGHILILDKFGDVVSTSISLETNQTGKQNIEIDTVNNTEEYTVYKMKVFGNDYYYMFANYKGFVVFANLPVEEAHFSRDISTYLNIFTEVIIFGYLFAMIYLSIKNLVVNNIVKIDKSLGEITGGNLNVKVDVRDNEEFSSLSDGINSTVDTLKRLIAEANERIDSELRYAREIQFSALPNIFPPYPNRSEFDIYALMKPAREVGGDFYDFYLLRKRILVFLVADVSGKGIPASLFMMRAKTTLKTYAESGMPVDEILTKTNEHLFEGNEAGMFVTAWMGILNLETGELLFGNAGHNKPLIRRKNGRFEYLKELPGLVLAGFENVTFEQQHLKLEPGDEIFLYTDGVVEATNTEKKLYGDDRLLECINRHRDEDAETMCKSIEEEVEEFYKGAPQFDDITELSFKFKEYFVDTD